MLAQLVDVQARTGLPIEPVPNINWRNLGFSGIR